MALDLRAAFSALTYDSSTRPYRLQASGEMSSLLVEAWSCKEALSTPWELHLSTLSPQAGLDIQAMLGQRVTLQTVLADGSLHERSGLVTHATSNDADAGFARYTLTVRPWIALLAHSRRSQVWQEKSLVDIIETVFARYARVAQWRWADGVSQHLAQSPFLGSGSVRSYTVQYRETDLDLVCRLLAEEGLNWRTEEDPDAPSGHTVVIFADSPSTDSCPEDSTSAAGSSAGPGVRYHRASSQETCDTIQALGALRILPSASHCVLAWDYAAKRSIAAEVPTRYAFGGANAPRLEVYDNLSAYAFATSAQAQRAGVLRQEALEARHKSWLGRSTVRSFAPGLSFTLSQSPLETLLPTDTHSPANRFVLSSVTHAGINNLPKAISDQVAHHFGDGGPSLLADWVDADVRKQVVQTGYGNAFEALRADVPWRPEPMSKPKAPGPLLATVVGADGSSSPSQAQEIYTDRLGRIRIRHEFQPEGEGSTWVRVAQAHAGPGMGSQFLPRIGQQVLVGFLDDDFDRPYVQGALYTGRGEAGLPATPGGKPGRVDESVYARSNDHRPSAQGNLAGGNSPAWHGGSPAEIGSGGQRNAAALSGWKTQEFNGQGFNQLVFDDSDRQLRTQLATTQHASQLNLGHLIHQADNHRGSFRGLGFELRTDAYGAIRGAKGVLISSYAAQPSEPAGDNAAGIALAKQFAQLSQTFSDAAKVHQTVQFASSIGSVKAKQSALSDKEAPLNALHTAMKGMVSAASFDAASGDAAAKNTGTEGKLPHLSDPIVAVSAKAGLAIAAGQDVVLSAGEGIAMGAGQDSHMAVGGAARIHSGQAIGVLGGAVGPGDQAAGTGITLIAGKGDIEVQAQSDTLSVAAKGDVSIQSKFSHIDWAAAKKIVLQTKGGASITIEGGNITVQCPGTITVKAGQKSFIGPERAQYVMPGLPQHVCVDCLLKARAAGSAFAIR